MSYQAVILAGGLGTRLRAVVSDVPKPMAPIDGVPFLEHLMSFWIDQGVTSFVLSVGYRWETIRDHFGTSFRDAKVEYAVEEIPLGTGGGLCLAASKLDPCDDFLLLNGDTFFEVRLEELRAFHAKRKSDLTLSLFSVPENTRYSGVEIASDGKVVSFQAQGQGPRSINGGVYIVGYDLLENMISSMTPLSLETGLFARWLAEGKRIFGAEFEGRFIDIGVPEDYQRAPGILKEAHGKI